jgi:hypothetical protein
MQAPRNWRSKVQRYRLTGVQYSNGETNLLNRPQLNVQAEEVAITVEIEEENAHVTAA